MKQIEILENESQGHIIVCHPSLENEVGQKLFRPDLPEWRSQKNADERGFIHFTFISPADITIIRSALGVPRG